MNLIRDERLIAGVNFLGELLAKSGATCARERARRTGATYEDAETLAIYAGLRPETAGYHDFVSEVMS